MNNINMKSQIAGSFIAMWYNHYNVIDMSNKITLSEQSFRPAIHETVIRHISPTPMSQALFVFFDGDRCPHCLSTNTEVDEWHRQVMSHVATYAHCHTCGINYTTHYDVSGWSEDD